MTIRVTLLMFLSIQGFRKDKQTSKIRQATGQESQLGRPWKLQGHLCTQSRWPHLCPQGQQSGTVSSAPLSAPARLRVPREQCRHPQSSPPAVLCSGVLGFLSIFLRPWPLEPCNHRCQSHQLICALRGLRMRKSKCHPSCPSAGCNAPPPEFRVL